MQQYHSLKEKYSGIYTQLNNQYNLIGTIRLIIALVFLILTYFYYYNHNHYFTIPIGIALIAFIILIRVHRKIGWNRLIHKTLVKINEDEITYLNKEGIPFDEGSLHQDFHHAYSYDLDIFCKNSLYHNLNRTASYIGGKKLSNYLLSLLPQNEIKANQEAIQELTKKLDWRQYLLSLTILAKDSKDIYTNLLKWADTKSEKASKALEIYAILSPITIISCFTAYLITDIYTLYSISSYLVLINLGVAFFQASRIRHEIEESGKISTTLKQYSLVLKGIENEEFTSQKLKDLKSKIIYKSGAVSTQIETLSSHFSNLDSIQNVAVAILFNGAFLFHIHVFIRFLKWKEEFAPEIKNWLEVMGEFEALNSFANLAYNNPEFIYPSLNSDLKIEMENLGHPLIHRDKRVCNTANFNQQNFVILTGSNMSGKSTFLRTLGINMVLTGIGAPICATSANIHPLNVIVSMRLSDSLTESESYFFAEVKRLKQIMEVLEYQPSFILLDEILRGTNSDDKRSGTIGVVKKLIAKNGIGVVATHDLEVCLTTDEYPDKLKNMCFEVEIINNELVFDYKLRNGICKNKSATFLMKKMEII